MNIKNFAAAKQQMENPKRDTQGYGYKYADLKQVKEIIDPACAEHGIDYVQFQKDGMLHTIVCDMETGEQIVTDVRQLGTGNDQQRGSSETYQRRYALLTVFGLAPEDDDGAAASKPQDKEAPDPVKAAKHRLWAALRKYAPEHGTTAEVLLEGIQKRPDYAETQEFFDQVAYEFETA